MFPRVKKLFRTIRKDGLIEAFRAIGKYINNQLKLLIVLPLRSLSRNGFFPATGVFTRHLLGIDLYRSFMYWKHGELVLRKVNGYELYINMNDPGLSSALLSLGIHEVHSTEALKQELNRMRKTTDDKITVIECGANLGYYALLEAKHLQETADIHAFEPSPENFKLLQMNVSHNDCEDYFTIHQTAVGAKEDKVELRLADRWNQNAIRSESIKQSEVNASESKTVDQVSLDSYIQSEHIAPEDVDFVRMDVQGYEYEVLQGMKSVLETDSSLLIFLETHWNKMKDENVDEIIDILSANRFSIIHSAKNFKKLDYQDFDDLREGGGEVILRR